MSKFLRALELGLEILTDVDLLLHGVATSFEFSYQGRKFTVNINPKS